MSSENCCECRIVHTDTVRKVALKLNSDDTLLEMAEVFQCFSDPTRLKIIHALLLSEMCVCDLTALLNLAQPSVSHHLKLLRQTHLVKFRKEGKTVYYSLDDEHVEQLFSLCQKHLSENARPNRNKKTEEDL